MPDASPQFHLTISLCPWPQIKEGRTVVKHYRHLATAVVPSRAKWPKGTSGSVVLYIITHASRLETKSGDVTMKEFENYKLLGHEIGHLVYSNGFMQSLE
jgi:hypothetical protein